MKFLLLFALLPLLTLNSDSDADQRPGLADTVRVLTFALVESLSDKYMPGASKVFVNQQETIFLATQSLSTSFLRSNLDEKSFNVASSDTICARIKRGIPGGLGNNYLEISMFENQDTCFYVQIRNLGCEHLSGGGTLGLDLKMKEDSVIVLRRTSTAIN